MRRDWKAGDVALATRIDGRQCRAILRHDGTWRLAEPGDAPPCGLRPLVVIDPEDLEAVARLADAIRQTRIDSSMTDLGAALREFANPKPPKPDEPTTWGVVEASCAHSTTRKQWVRHPDGNWWPAWDYSQMPERTPQPDDWDSLVDPVVIREGVPA